MTYDRATMDDVRRDRAALVSALGVTLKGKSCKCVFHDDKHASGSVYQHEGVWKFTCHTCSYTGDVFDVRARIENRSLGDVLAEYKPEKPKHYPSLEAIKDTYPNVEAVYKYTNPATNQVELGVIRYRIEGRKAFAQCSPNGAGWLKTRPEGKLPLYNRKRVGESETVIVVEGEKTVHALFDIGIVATTSPMGAGKAKEADWSLLEGKKIYLWPDNDPIDEKTKRQSGIEHMKDVQSILETMSCELYWIEPSGLDLPPKGDAADFLIANGGEDADKKMAVALVLDEAQPLGAAQELGKRFQSIIAGEWVNVEWPWPMLTGEAQSLLPDTVTAVCGDPGAGKALALDTPIATSRGWTTMGEIEAGESVFDEQGAPCTVVGTTGVMHGRPCYRVVFSDGAEFIADAEHQWLTRTNKARTSTIKTILNDRKAKKGYPTKSRNQQHLKTTSSIVTTEQIAKSLYAQDGRFNHSVKNSEPLSLPRKRLPVDPYVLGVWLGDGHSHTGYITTADDEVITAIERRGYKTRKLKARYLYAVDRLGTELKSLGLLRNKHVPFVYLRASSQQRLDLIRGLMDTDGTISKSGGRSFCNTNPQIIAGLKELLGTFGVQSQIKTKRAKLYGRDCGEAYQINFTTFFSVFYLYRKQRRERLDKSSPRMKWRQIVSVEKVESVPVRCIEVNSESHLYLAGKEFVPTHNSFQLLQAFWHWHLTGRKVAIFELEDDRTFHLQRVLAQLEGNALLTDIQWVMNNGEKAMASHENQKDILGSLGKMIWDAPDKQVTLTELADWFETRCAEGFQICIIDPVTAAVASDKPWIDDQKFIFRVKTTAKKYHARLIYAIHPRVANGKVGASLSRLAGGAAYARFSHSVLWLTKLERDKTDHVWSPETSSRLVSFERTVKISKARNGRGAGAELAFHLNAGSLCFEEYGSIIHSTTEKQHERG